MMTENSDNNKEIDKAAVKAFLEENGISTSDSDRLEKTSSPVVEEEEAPKEQPDDQEQLIPESVMNAIGDLNKDQEPKEEPYENTKLTPDTTFEENGREKANKVFVPVLDVNVPITDSDKDTYFKAMLFDTPIELPVLSMEGNVTVICRTLNVYENDLVYVALEQAMKERQVPASVWEGLCQQYRMSMQLVKFNGKPLDCLRFNADGDTKKDAEILLEKSKQIYNMSMPKYNLLIRALNVFQYKINKLNEAIYNQGFWNPGGIG